MLCKKVKTRSKEPPKWVHIPLNYIFICFKNQKGSIIVWIIIKVFGIFSINCKVYMFKAWHKSKMFLHVQSIQTFKINSLFFLPNVHHSFWKLERILTLKRRAKGLELMKFFFITNFSTFGSNVLLTLKIMDFENVTLTKVLHIYLIEGMNA